MRKRLVIQAVLLGALVAWAAPARGALPRRIAFQGRLTDAAGAPLTGIYAVQFRILDAAAPGSGNECHAETQEVLVTTGVFNAFVGAGGTDGRISDACTFDRPYFLEITVGTDGAMEPRIPLVAAPYALVAERLFVETNPGDPCPTQAWPAGNERCNIPVSNRGLNQGLNADLWHGRHLSDIDRQLHHCQGIAVAPGGTCELRVLNLNSCGDDCAGAGSAPACPTGCTDLGQRCVAVGYGSCTNYLSLSDFGGIFGEDESHAAKMRRCVCPAVPYGNLMRPE